jgi:predicted protein tyrosine phosphatase|tara:strand:+ start:273 stop:551 length:279 start_codon:yes stop_codon:yes gene_type:complete
MPKANLMNTDIQPEPLYKTSDLYFAAYLKTTGMELLKTELEGRKVIFVFEKSHRFKDLKREYFNRTSRVPALTFVDEIRSMKSLTFMAREDG